MRQKHERFHQGLTRRQVLQACGASAFAAGLAEPLQASNSYGARSAHRVKNLIWIQVNGGLSHLDTFDPKPAAPDGIRSPYQTIPTRLPGVRFTELLPRLAAIADKFRLVRGMHQIIPGSAHTDGSRRIMTGESDIRKDHPYFGSVVARLNPATRPVPSYVWIQELIDVDARYRQGGAHAPFFVTAGYGAESAYEANYARLGIEGTLAQARTLTTADLRRRHALLEQVMPFQNPGLTPGRGEEFCRHQHNAMELLTSNDTRNAFALEREPDAIRRRYGFTPIGQNLLTARRLLERGVRAVGMPAWAGDFPGLPTCGGGRNMWDHHYCGMFRDDFAGGYGFMVPRVDQVLAALIEDLEQRGMLSSTLVVMTSEMGSSPQIGQYGNEGAIRGLSTEILNDRSGRNHWPQCWTALLAGAGVTGGVYGGSDRSGAYPDAGRAVSPEIFGATVYHALGIPPDTLLDSANPLSKVSTGQPLMEVFS
ncbi:MAG TPA: DUF1501 domain-containing protein [Gemmataceae bacterium]|nr:DUF1501 domain-containing protein [Gemmataceae bacterium]